jgi:hypothetical protein
MALTARVGVGETDLSGLLLVDWRGTVGSIFLADLSDATTVSYIALLSAFSQQYVRSDRLRFLAESAVI